MMPSLVIAHAARVAFGLNRRTPPGAGSRQTDMNQQIASISALLRTSSRALARLMQRSPLSMATLAQKTPMICPRHSVFGRSLLNSCTNYTELRLFFRTSEPGLPFSPSKERVRRPRAPGIHHVTRPTRQAAALAKPPH